MQLALDSLLQSSQHSKRSVGVRNSNVTAYSNNYRGSNVLQHDGGIMAAKNARFQSLITQDNAYSQSDMTEGQHYTLHTLRIS
jgi:hypothetical protein